MPHIGHIRNGEAYEGQLQKPNDEALPPEIASLRKLIFEYSGDDVETRLRMLVASLRDGSDSKAGLPKSFYTDIIEDIYKPVVESAEQFMGEAIIARHQQANGQWEKTESFIRSYQRQKIDDPHGIFRRLNKSDKE